MTVLENRIESASNELSGGGPHLVVRWEELLPEEFERQLRFKPVVYLPLGLCEPHGHIAPFGLDTLKAEYLCMEAAHRFGGIVAPTMAYQIHESGYHKPWLDEVIGTVNPRLAALPPHVVLETFLYQLRAFRNAGFRAVVAISGHAGGNQYDLRLVAEAFTRTYTFEHFVCADPELVAGRIEADHAGRYEISQLLAIRPDLIRLGRAHRAQDADLGRLGQNPDATDASAEFGREIHEAQLARIGDVVRDFKLEASTSDFISFDDIEPIWAELFARRNSWRTLNL
jgi:creatinine amidohydrolase